YLGILTDDHTEVISKVTDRAVEFNPVLFAHQRVVSADDGRDGEEFQECRQVFYEVAFEKESPDEGIYAPVHQSIAGIAIQGVNLQDFFIRELDHIEFADVKLIIEGIHQAAELKDV